MSHVGRRRFLQGMSLGCGCLALVATSPRRHDWALPLDNLLAEELRVDPATPEHRSAWLLSVVARAPSDRALVHQAKSCTLKFHATIHWEASPAQVESDSSPSVVIIGVKPRVDQTRESERATWLETKQTAVAVRPGGNVKATLTALWDTSYGCRTMAPCQEAFLLHVQWKHGHVGHLKIAWRLDAFLIGDGRPQPKLDMEVTPTTLPTPRPVGPLAPLAGKTDAPTQVSPALEPQPADPRTPPPDNTGEPTQVPPVHREQPDAAKPE